MDIDEDRDTRWLKRLTQVYMDEHSFDLTNTGDSIPLLLKIRKEQIKNKKVVVS